MRRHAPVYWDASAATWDGGMGLWGVTRYEDIRTVASDQETFCSGNSSRPDSPPVPSMINHDEPVHMQRRGIVRRRFTPQAIRSYEPFIRASSTFLLNQVCERGRCDFAKDIATPLPMMLIGELLGMPQADYQKLLHWSDLFATGLQNMPVGFIDKVRQAVMEWNEYITFWFEKRLREPGDDLISALVHAKIARVALTHEELMHEAMLILVGGDETTRHVISGGMEALLRRPGLYGRLATNPDKLECAIEEMLRWVTPVKNMNRTATRDVVLGDQQIRKGDKLLLLYESGNRDEAVFDEPDEFDIERSPNHHLAFGGYGRHFCLGANLARLEIRVLFEEVLRRFSDMALADAGQCPYRHGNFVLGFEAVQVTFTPSAPERHEARKILA